MLPLHLLLLLVSSLVATFAVQSDIDCDEEAEPLAEKLALDCHHLLARIPSLPLPVPDIWQPTPPSSPSPSPSPQIPTPGAIRLSSPFLPRGQVGHGICEICINYFDRAAYTSRRRYTHWEGGDPPATESTVLWAWSMVRATALAIVDQCVKKGRLEGGTAYGSLETVPGLEGAAFELSVWAVPPLGSEARGPVHYCAKRLLNGEVGALNLFEDIFQAPYYIV